MKRIPAIAKQMAMVVNTYHKDQKVTCSQTIKVLELLVEEMLITLRREEKGGGQ